MAEGAIGELGTKGADWPKSVNAGQHQGGQAGCKVTGTKSNENKSKGATSGSLYDNCFHEASKQFTVKNIPTKPLSLNSRTSNGDDFWSLFLFIS